MNDCRLITITPEIEKLIGFCARVSNPANQDNPDVSKLLKYCIDNKHWSIFEMGNMVCNVFGKDIKSFELFGTIDLDDMVFNVAISKGKLSVSKGKKSICGDDGMCRYSGTMNTGSGTITGYIDDVVCDPCGDSMWSWAYNTCLDGFLTDPLENQAEINILSGTWAMKLNKKLSAKCVEDGFYDAIEDKIPSKYAW